MSTQLTDHLKLSAQTNNRLTVSGLRGSSPALLISILASTENCCCILADEHQVGILEDDLRLFSSVQVLTYPGYEIPPYTPLSPDQATIAARLSTLYQLLDPGARFILIVSAEALMRRVMPKEILTRSAELLMTGEEYAQDELITSLIHLGYEQVSLVQTVGNFSVRGGIIDIYPPPFTMNASQGWQNVASAKDGAGASGRMLQDGPIRLDFFGDTVESLRVFDPITQRSQQELQEAILLPVSDILIPLPAADAGNKILLELAKTSENLQWDSEQTAQLGEQIERRHHFSGIEFFLPLFYQDLQRESSTVFEFLPADTRLIFLDPEAGRKSTGLVHERILANYASAQQNQTPALLPAQLFLDTEQLEEAMTGFAQLFCSDFNSKGKEILAFTTTNHQLLKQDIGLQRKKRGLLAPLNDQIQVWQEQGDQVILCCRSSRHARTLAELLEKHQHDIQFLPAPLTPLESPPPNPGNSIFVCEHPLNEGFTLVEHKVHLLSESELFGEMRLGGKSKKKSARQNTGDPVRFADLKILDVVVHRDHGLGIYHGLVTMEIQGIKNDFMLLEYKGGDRLYLPVDRLNLISRYEGLSDREPRIDKLGTQSWQSAKSKVKEEVWKVAQELLKIYARREMRQGKRFSPPGELYHELEESFPFDETAGQDKAITETIDDLTSDQPMDRLVCGDVGYGKTEVAIRAAFKVVEDGCQVAILVPTTVLAEQHAKTFKERMSGFPVTIDCINRFRSSADQKRIIKDLALGKIDIIIGTHRLLSKDVVYNNLGLLIVDEEHRFGVSHKEKIKQIKAEVDILTLTATPIPRTLEMSLLGIRDLSVISSPPEHRRPVKTFVARYDKLVIKEAVSKEMLRQGQVFFVHNRVKSIHRMAATVQELVPEARIAVAHGQMVGKDLEAIMVDFVSGKIDVLICTTIIESGLDIPSANTIIINRADTLGLAEIYQLRGRVGRSSTQSYAYLLVPSLDDLSRDSKDRLRALIDCNELGGGFKLAMSDLQIRGGGNLLGVSQSGHIAAIGYELYLDLLQKTVADLKARAMHPDTLSSEAVEELDPEINLQISAYIPESYIPDVSQRYIAYRRISSLATADIDQHTDLEDELLDRYGTLPAETINLLQVVSLKKELAGLKINKLEKGKDALVFSFLKSTPIDPTLLLQYLEKNRPQKKKVPATQVTLSPWQRGKTKPQTRTIPERPGPTLTPDGRLVIPVEFTSPESLFTAIRKALADLSRLVPTPKES
ncbi:MAG: transcription-repair coupling factor [Proteobacteria bacterium]|jgi:transcription-repair coupling factor (superfamily II helicase)|nr:transcription-repair coupling factor [Desulfocapsa sp.]MBU3943170.1 transcription-repair coupling factor [Pseudomonadota bacterium]MCG2745059.1 transcription-repair coupling factor [Desulfobacteraceae bacterium]MBU4030333.1 transcription-repair coupling factor [Pseudomonadota bacterium]MBU4041753.1 transcription-repair coupling factor [Pseudomonadota bacterium]